VCIFFVPPQAGHLLRFVRSFKALPAICLCLFFMCEVFFLGTALRMPSHMSPSNEGMLEMAAGIAIARAGIEGNGDCRNDCDRTIDLKEELKAGEANRGKRAEKADAIRTCCMAAIVMLNVTGSVGLGKRRNRWFVSYLVRYPDSSSFRAVIECALAHRSGEGIEKGDANQWRTLCKRDLAAIRLSLMIC
jgi:hypothetical protein